MIVVNKANTKKWVVVYSNDKSVFHFMAIEAGRVCETGLPNSEVFDTEEDWIDRLDELKGEGYYQSQIQQLSWSSE